MLSTVYGDGITSHDDHLSNTQFNSPGGYFHTVICNSPEFHKTASSSGGATFMSGCSHVHVTLLSLVFSFLFLFPIHNFLTLVIRITHFQEFALPSLNNTNTINNVYGPSKSNRKAIKTKKVIDGET